MKRAICLLLCVVMVAPVFAVGRFDAAAQMAVAQTDTELSDQISILKGETDSRELKILALQSEIADLKKANEVSTTARYLSLAFGVWGIATFGATGGLYPLVTGLLFMKGAMK